MSALTTPLSNEDHLFMLLSLPRPLAAIYLEVLLFDWVKEPSDMADMVTYMAYETFEADVDLVEVLELWQNHVENRDR